MKSLPPLQFYTKVQKEIHFLHRLAVARKQKYQKILGRNFCFRVYAILRKLKTHYNTDEYFMLTGGYAILKAKEAIKGKHK